MRIIKPSKRPGKGRLTSQADFLDHSQQGDDVSFATKSLTSANSDTDKASDNQVCGDELSHRSDSAKKEYNNLFGRGIRLLAMREHSVKELTDKLLAKGDLADVVYGVIDDLVEQNLLSNDRFAENYVRARTARGFGPLKIQTELSAKGIDSGLISEYLDMNSAIWFDNAAAQYDKKYGEAPVSDYNEWSRRARFMQSRGFTMEHIQVTLPKVDFD